MKVQVVLELDVEFETDGEELDYSELRAITQGVLQTHIENLMNDDQELEMLIDGISEQTDFPVNSISYEVK